MALSFTLSIECGPTRDQAEQVAAHFAGYKALDHRGALHLCHTEVSEIDPGGWWVIVWPENVSNRGVSSEEEAFEMNAIASGFYSMLRSAPTFRYAIVGIEVDGFRSFSEIDQDFVKLGFDGLVISHEIWKQLGAPHDFEPFCREYLWREFKGVR